MCVCFSNTVFLAELRAPVPVPKLEQQSLLVLHCTHQVAWDCMYAAEQVINDIDFTCVQNRQFCACRYCRDTNGAFLMCATDSSVAVSATPSGTSPVSSPVVAGEIEAVLALCPRDHAGAQSPSQ